MQAKPAERFGKYELLAHIATGGMADIFLARLRGDAGFEKLVVVKRLLDKLASDPEYVEMFLDEARINARLSHTNVVQVLELGKVDGRYFMAMEYVTGLSVAQIGKLATQRLGMVPQAIACGIVAQAAAGLHYAHEKTLPDGTPLGIIHRDISPQNLILTLEGQVKVVDFGIAKAAGRATATRAGIIKGKFAYMSPEQCVGDPIDRRCDVFALGIVLFELCTSRRLFKRENTYRTYEAITNCDVPEPRTVNPQIAPEVSAVIVKALGKKAEDRYQTAEALQEALDRAMARSGLRGSTTHLTAFLEKTFPEELEAQRQLISSAQSGALVGRGAQGADKVAAALTEGDPDEPTSVYGPEGEPVSEPTSVDEIPKEPPPKEQVIEIEMGTPAFPVQGYTPPAPAPPPVVPAPVPRPAPVLQPSQFAQTAPVRRAPLEGEGFPWFTFLVVMIVVATSLGVLIVLFVKK
jgi:eukaryotic-like serine/threonine-protein kinase